MNDSDAADNVWSARALPALADTLRHFGYDLESSGAGNPPLSIVARRDRGDRVVVLAIDAGGRFRVEITRLVGEWPSRDVIATVPVRVIDSVSRAVTITGAAADPQQMVEFINALESAFPWAGPAEPKSQTGTDAPPRPE